MSSVTTEIAEATPSTLAFIAGYLAGAIDKRFNLRNTWTLKVYMDMEQHGLTIGYIHRLEREIHCNWPEGEIPPKASDLFRLLPQKGLTR